MSEPTWNLAVGANDEGGGTKMVTTIITTSDLEQELAGLDAASTAAARAGDELAAVRRGAERAASTILGAVMRSDPDAAQAVVMDRLTKKTAAAA